jgi:hypothetical protein
MTNVRSSNMPHADTALLTVPQKTPHYNTTDEGVFLMQQATDAKTAMQRTVADMQATAKEVINVRWWTRQYPWYAVGAAVVVGFVAATQVLAPAYHPAPPVPLAQRQEAVRPSWMASLFEMVSSTLVSTIIEAVRTRGQQSGRAHAGSSSSWASRHPRAPDPTLQ